VLDFDSQQRDQHDGFENGGFFSQVSDHMTTNEINNMYETPTKSEAAKARSALESESLKGKKQAKKQIKTKPFQLPQ
jgi:hypothetical protein